MNQSGGFTFGPELNSMVEEYFDYPTYDRLSKHFPIRLTQSIFRNTPREVIDNYILSGNILFLQRLLQSGYQVDRNILNIALINARSADIVKLLLQLGADVHTDKDEPLRSAVMNGNIEKAKLLIEAGANVTGNSILFWALDRGDVDMVKLFLGTGKDFSDVGYHDVFLDRAVKSENIDLVRLVLNSNMGVNHPRADPLNNKIIYAASWRNLPDILTLLISQGFDVNANNGKALVRASELGFENIVSILLNSGANVNIKEAITKACQNGHIAVVNLLVDSILSRTMSPPQEGGRRKKSRKRKSSFKKSKRRRRYKDLINYTF